MVTATTIGSDSGGGGGDRDGGSGGGRGGGPTFGRKGKCGRSNGSFFLPRWRAGFLTRPSIRTTCIWSRSILPTVAPRCAAANARKIGASRRCVTCTIVPDRRFHRAPTCDIRHSAESARDFHSKVPVPLWLPPRTRRNLDSRKKVFPSGSSRFETVRHTGSLKFLRLIRYRRKYYGSLGQIVLW